MPNNSQSSVQEAIAAIIERQQREGTVPAEFIFQANRVWIDRNLSKHLEPVFAEVARKIGLDKNKLDEAVARHEQEVTQYLKEQEAETDKNFAALTKIYREALANRKAAIEGAITTEPSIAPPPSVLMVLDKPFSIHGRPSDLLADEHIESWNSSTKIIWETTDKWNDIEAIFFFSWHNNSNESVVITGVTSSLTAAGSGLHPVSLTPA